MQQRCLDMQHNNTSVKLPLKWLVWHSFSSFVLRRKDFDSTLWSMILFWNLIIKEPNRRGRRKWREQEIAKVEISMFKGWESPFLYEHSYNGKLFSCSCVTTNRLQVFLKQKLDYLLYLPKIKRQFISSKTYGRKCTYEYRKTWSFIIQHCQVVILHQWWKMGHFIF